jgi:hypothetical protein
VQAVEFDSVLSEKGELAIPGKLAELLPRAQKLRVIVLFDEAAALQADQGWSQLSARQFLGQYSESDAIYDKD